MGPDFPHPTEQALTDLNSAWARIVLRAAKRHARRSGVRPDSQMPRRNTPKARRGPVGPLPGGRRPRHVTHAQDRPENLATLLGHPPRGRKR